MRDDPRYADADGTQIAYWALDGSGERDIVVVAGAFFPVEALLDDAVSTRFLEGLQGLGRVIVFDKRGVGLSDPVTDWERPIRLQWAEDLCAVAAAACAGPAVVVSWEPFGTARAAAVSQPARISHLALISAIPDRDGLVSRWQAEAGPEPADGVGVETRGLEQAAFPSRVDEPGFQKWLERAGRAGASPSMAARMWDATLRDAENYTPAGISCPTIVVHRRDSMIATSQVHLVAEAIPGARVVSVEGQDAFPIAGDPDPLVVEIARMLGVERALPAPDRLVGAVLFTDIVGSTVAAAATGDAAWKRMLDEHDAVVRGAVERAGGEVVKFTGDGVLAILPSAAGAIGAAQSMGQSLAAEGVAIRTGIHVGDVERRGDDVAGLSVHIAARVMAQAADGEIRVTDAVRRATLGADIDYESRGATTLKGIPDDWELFSVADSTGEESTMEATR